ncbi:hypothetical protein J2X90_005235 [Variovorax paradoxus]|uniref:hypothetical protein n=1 Tax=Variovorax paradoxus TaxID=34073 RepID=UPI00277D5FBA|nr:hypothetical protein [Variovorax paradoxus]MDQ0027400.1 hypothetical protein [Variovorax paradoxus]
MTTLPSLAGTLRVRPGLPRPHNLASDRRALAGLLLAGRSVVEAPHMLASLFTLCGHAHLLCATLALAAARGQDASASATQRRALRRETARDHALRIGLDWPVELYVPGALPAWADSSHKSLRGCPWLAEAPRPESDGIAWLADLLGTSPLAWLALWEREPAEWLAQWCERERGWLPGLLHACAPLANRVLQAAPPLRVHGSPSDLCAFAAGLGTAFEATAPTWRGLCAETGTWTRLHDPRAELPASAWERFGARIADLVRLSLPDAAERGGAGWLAAGALQTGIGEGLAWVETARGLLIHRARVDGRPADRRVAGYDVVAPTDWNFHRLGAVAHALERMPADGCEAGPLLRILMAAYDPCVRFAVESRTATAELPHA